MKIRTFGDFGRQKECERRLKAINKQSSYKTLFLLPIPTSRDGIYINGTQKTLESLLPEIEEGDFVAGYNIPEPYVSRMAELGAHIYDAGLDEGFLCDNADLTARGALGRILCEFATDMSEMKIAVVGYGRIGKRLLRYLLFLGADVTVYTGKKSTCLELSLEGASVRRTSDSIDMTGIDLLINTAPAHLISDSTVDSLGAAQRIIDLASGRFIKDAPGVIKLASVPDSMYPRTAGGLYAKYIARYLFDDREETV